MNVEYDPTALTLMRAIKQGIDPVGIMNPGTLLPPKNQPILTRTSTIDPEKVSDWVVGPHNLDRHVESDPRLPAPIDGIGSDVESWGNWIWDKVGGRLVRSMKDIAKTNTAKQDVRTEMPQENITKTRTEHGDGV